MVDIQRLINTWMKLDRNNKNTQIIRITIQFIYQNKASILKEIHIFFIVALSYITKLNSNIKV